MTIFAASARKAAIRVPAAELPLCSDATAAKTSTALMLTPPPRKDDTAACQPPASAAITVSALVASGDPAALALLQAMADGDVQAAGRDLTALQRPDGGWGQTPEYAPDAYSTGQAVYALRLAGLGAKVAVTITKVVN